MEGYEITQAKMDEIVQVALAIIDEKVAELRELERPTLAESEWIADE